MILTVAPYVPLFRLDDFAERGELANFVFMLPIRRGEGKRDKSHPSSLPAPISIVPSCGDISRLSRQVYVSGVRIASSDNRSLLNVIYDVVFVKIRNARNYDKGIPALARSYPLVTRRRE